MFESKHFCF